MKEGIKHEGMWWSFIETCDRCGSLVQDYNVKQTNEPDVQELDFCYYCLKYFLDNKITYEEIKKQYKGCNYES